MGLPQDWVRLIRIKTLQSLKFPLFDPIMWGFFFLSALGSGEYNFHALRIFRLFDSALERTV
jgi:hypothetical protein